MGKRARLGAWLHSSSFEYVELDDAGDWGWRTWSKPDHSTYIELCVDKSGCQYVARSYNADQQISEIWTSLHPIHENTEIDVSFNVAQVAESARPRLTKIYLDLYELLWDEDEIMMAQRQTNLNPLEAGPDEIDLGTWELLRQRLPLTLRLGHRSWLLRNHEGELLIHTARCPHSLGPLAETIIMDNQIRCPWHGYQFDVISGTCVYPDQAMCRLPAPPQVHHDPETRHLILKH